MSSSPFDFPVSGRVDPQLLAGMRELVGVLHRAGTTSTEAGAAAKKAGNDWQAFRDRVSQAAEAFNNVWMAAGRIYGVLNQTAEALAHSAGEAQRLSRGARDLGVDFAEAARGAGGVVDELELLNLAQGLASRGISMSQTQLQAFARTAQDYARGSGKEFREVGEQLAEVIAKGGEEAARFGPALGALAAPTSSAQERLAALVATTQESAPAARTAAESYRDFQQSLTDAQRTFADGFVEGLAEMRRVHGETTSARDVMRELKDDVYALGGAAATVFATIADSVRVVATEVSGWVEGLADAVSTLDAIRRNPLSAPGALRALGARETARENASMDAFERLMRTLRGGDGRTSIDVQGGSAPAGPALPARAIGNDTEGGNDGSRAADFQAFLQQTARGGGGSNPAASTSLLTVGSAEVNAIFDRVLGQSQSRRAEDFERLTTAALGLREAEEIRSITGVSREDAAARYGDTRDPVDDRNARLNRRQRGGTLGDMMDDRAAARERRTLEQRIDGLQSFTDRWRDLHHEQVDVTREATTFLDAGLKGLGQSVTTHGKAILAGGEQAARGLRSILSETAGAFADESFMKAGFYAAEAIAALVRWDLPGAGTAAAASAAYLVAGAGASAIGAAAAPPALPSMSGAMPGGGPGGGAQPVGPRGDKGGEGGGQNINITFGGPVVGGSAAQIGRELGRYLNTANTQTGFQLAPGVAATR